MTPDHLHAASGESLESDLDVLLAVAGDVPTPVPVPTVDLSEYPIDPAAAGLIPDKVARRLGVLGIGFEDAALVVAMSDPGNVLALDDIRIITGLELRRVGASAEGIAEARSRLGQVLDDAVGGIVAAAEEDLPDEDPALVRKMVEDAPIVRLVDMVVARAVVSRASDIHIEPGERDLRVRYRIDGVLHEVMRLQKSLQAAIISRIKIISDMDIAERRVPQDGRAEVTTQGQSADLRVATLPTKFGEKTVIRILDKSNVRLDLRDLGFSPATFERYTSTFRRPQGMILVTGPTGSGKSTTLYATLNALNSPERNVITVEDPVEYLLPGAYQVQVNPKAGLTFAAALRSILRSDPDIVLVGEIRDRETAMLAIDAALTGHLVLSSLHTNDAPSAVSRLTNMGVEPFLVASALDGVLGQRLVRLLCDRCKEPFIPQDSALREAGIRPPREGPPVTLMRPVGCPRCSGTGYSGRFGVHETMLRSEEIERLTVERRSSEEIARAARGQGMSTLYEDAAAKVLAGLTSLEELVRVVGVPCRGETFEVAEPSLVADVGRPVLRIVEPEGVIGADASARRALMPA
jgi:type IV pilus assembly protein PilB